MFTAKKTITDWIVPYRGLLSSICLLIWLLALTASFIPALSDLFEDSKAAHIIYRGIFMVALLGSLVYLTMKRKEFCPFLLNNSPLNALILLGLISTLWSITPGITLKSSLIIIAVVLSAYSTSKYFEAQHFLKILIGFLTTFVIISAIIWLADYPWPFQGESFRSFFSQKNHMGIISALYILLLTSFAIHTNKQNITLVISTLSLGTIAILLLTASGSAGSIVETISCIGLLSLLLITDRTKRPKRNLLILALIAATSLYLSWDYILQLLNRSPTLTGRDKIWELSLGAAKENFLLGIGLGTAWLQNSPVYLAVATVMPATKHAHNGYLEIYIEVGVIGLTLFLVHLGLVAHNIFKNISLIINSFITLSFLSIILFFLILNTIESTIFRMPFIFYIYLVSAFYLQKATSVALVKTTSNNTKLGKH